MFDEYQIEVIEVTSDDLIIVMRKGIIKTLDPKVFCSLPFDDRASFLLNLFGSN